MSFNVDQDFDQYRRQRIRQGLSSNETDSNYDNAALRELEQVEQREVRDQQLTREVHEFFSSATQQAATIVERMAHDAEAEADQRISNEVEAFLLDSFARMNTLVIAMINKKRGQGGEEKVEPNLNNIVGPALDEFRFEGTAELPDKHIGQDPFATDLDDVVREFHFTVNEHEQATAAASASIAEHLVATAAAEAPVVGEEEGEEPAGEVAEAEPDCEPAAAPEPEPEPEAMVEATPAAESEPQVRAKVNRDDELERFKQALRSLVKQGTMTRDEARAAWATRLQSLGLV